MSLTKEHLDVLWDRVQVLRCSYVTADHHLSVKHLGECSRTFGFADYELCCDFWFKFVQAQLIFALTHCQPLTEVVFSYLN